MNEINSDFVKVTEAAAIAASNWIGTGNKLEADKAATDAMSLGLNEMDFEGVMKICEGIKDESHYILKNERFGNIFGPQIYDIAADAIDGTTATVTDGNEAMSVMAFAKYGAMRETDEFYMHKLAYGPKIAQKAKLNLADDLEVIVKQAATILEKSLDKMTVCMLNRPRHDKYVAQLRSLGVKIKLIQDCDVSWAIATSLPNNKIDLLYGIGGAPEAIIACCAIKNLGGDFQAIVSDKDGNFSGSFLSSEDLVTGPTAFVATGITNGNLLKGVKVKKDRYVVNSVFMKDNEIRWSTTSYDNKNLV